MKHAKFDKNKYLDTLNLLRRQNVNTVCVQANCPNRYECFADKTATFMILGNVCTRNCGYCNVKKGLPERVADEAGRIVETAKELGLDYVVVTSVTRDDLEDGGAERFAILVRALKQEAGCEVEVLIPDFQGDKKALHKVLDAEPDVVNHNIEVVKHYFDVLRPKGDYQVSLDLLSEVKKNRIATKSGIMLGFGETKEQVLQTLQDLRLAGVDFVTIGQYLQPNPESFVVVKNYSPEEFEYFRSQARKMGFKGVASGRLVRSSYHAKEMAAAGKN